MFVPRRTALVWLMLAMFVTSVVAQQPPKEFFHITPVRPIAELRAEALKQRPPLEDGPFVAPALAELVTMDPSIHLDIRYATPYNFMSTPVYEEGRAFLQKPAADALLRVSKKLAKQGYGLAIFDAYRPWYITWILWNATPPDKQEFVADPKEGSRHNRGCAVDLTLYDLKTGEEVSMPSLYDEMSPRSYADYKDAKPDEAEHRAILRSAMESEGFEQRPNEWWHYDYKDWKNYPILNMRYSDIPVTKDTVPAGKKLTPPKGIDTPDPDYTEEARRKRISGTVEMWVVLNAKGQLTRIVMLKKLGGGLDESAVRAVMKWRFGPAMLDGVPVPWGLRIEMNFHL